MYIVTKYGNRMFDMKTCECHKDKNKDIGHIYINDMELASYPYKRAFNIYTDIIDALRNNEKIFELPAM